MKKKCLLTFHDKNFEELANVTLHQNKVKYAEKYGYDCIYKTDNFSKHIMFDKLYCLDELFKSGKYDWIFWSDADAMITNFTTSIEQLTDDNFHFIVATDFNGINAGTFLIRCSNEGRSFLDYQLNNVEKYIKIQGQEQQCIQDAYDKTDFKKIIKIVPQKVMNSYQYELYQSRYGNRQNCKNKVDCLGNNGDWEYGDFIVHYPDVPQHLRIILAKEMLKKIKY